jgi:hypothetical protein
VLLPYLGHNWFTVLRHFLALVIGSLHIPGINTGLPTPNRLNDACLMDTVTHLSGVTPADLTRFNAVRIWMGVTHLSRSARPMAPSLTETHGPALVLGTHHSCGHINQSLVLLGFVPGDGY